MSQVGAGEVTVPDRCPVGPGELHRGHDALACGHAVSPALLPAAVGRRRVRSCPRGWLLCLLGLSLARGVAAPSLAVASDGRIRRATWTADGPQPAADLPGEGVTAVVWLRVDGQPHLLGAQGEVLLDLAPLPPVGQRLPQPIRQLLPTPDGEQLLVLVGRGAGTVPEEGAVYRLTRPGATPQRIEAVRPTWRPWRLGWARAGGGWRLVVATHKETRYWRVPHHCLFVFDWQDGQAVPWWLGSRLSRPYRDAVHGPLREAPDDRLVALETTAERQTVVMVYHPMGFGYQGEWESAAVPGAERLLRLGAAVVVWGRRDGSPWWARLHAAGEGYRLVDLPEPPPVPDAVVSAPDDHWAGYWHGAWHSGRLGE